MPPFWVTFKAAWCAEPQYHSDDGCTVLENCLSELSARLDVVGRLVLFSFSQRE